MAAPPPARSRRRRRLSPGLRAAAPVLALLAFGFAAPLATVAAMSVSPPGSFAPAPGPDLQAWARLVDPAGGLPGSFAVTLGLAAATVAALLAICLPLAHALVHLFGRWSGLVSTLFVFPLFVSENVRLYGWALVLLKNGLLDGTMKALGLGPGPDWLFTPAITLAGMIYVHLPFMLFPVVLGLSLVPRETVEAARDLGASRARIWAEIVLPLASPGILIGMLLTFTLAAGALAEARILGGQSVIPVAQEIETAFSYAQDWPGGAAMALALVLITGALALALLAAIDLDRLLGRRR
ncbi:ABC transporter permease [Frigidibacter sp. MR17.24]|uniref:ABC transporter permease n=1 Tax=Frigidibacter sp. MR17.24 TaxID=3127345 RepID=UPI003012E779